MTSKMLFWTIYGLGDVKADGRNYMNKFDIIGFTEMWFSKKREDEVKNRLKICEALMSGSTEVGGRRRNPKEGVILAFEKQIVEEIYEKYFILKKIVRSKFKMRNK